MDGPCQKMTGSIGVVLFSPTLLWVSDSVLDTDGSLVVFHQVQIVLHDDDAQSLLRHVVYTRGRRQHVSAGE